MCIPPCTSQPHHAVRARRFGSGFPLVVLIALLALCTLPARAAPVSVTKTNPDDAEVGPGQSTTRSVSFTTADFPAGSLVEDVVVTLKFRRFDTTGDNANGCLVPGDLNPRADRMYYYLTSPEGTRVVLIENEDNSGGSGTGETYSTGSFRDPYEEFTVVFDDDAAESVQQNPPGDPRSGTFRPVQPLSGVDGEAAIGTWTLTIGDAGSDRTCHNEFSVTLGATLPADTTPPVITISSPTNNATYLLNQVVTASYSCDDGSGSGVASCSGPVANGAAIDTATVGSQTFTVTASDNAGNPASASRNYTVVYGFPGFSQPVDNTVPNRAKAGQTIPLKWRLTDATGTPVTTLTAVQVTVASLSCAFGSTPDAVEEYASGSSGLQNLGDGYYQFNWKTPKSYAGSCETLQLNLGEGIYRTAAFQFTP